MTTMTVDRAGRAPAQERTVHFVEPLPGFDDEDTYTLSGIDDRGLLYSLRSVHDPSLRFVLTPAECFFDDYRPELAPVVTESLGSTGDDDVQLMLMLTIASGLLQATANLRAPIVVAPSSGRAMQVVLDDESLPMQRRLVEGA
jgi:flagellar assembly factor FliW